MSQRPNWIDRLCESLSDACEKHFGYQLYDLV